MFNFLEEFKRLGILKENSHFILSSGNHSDKYLNKDEIWYYPKLRNTIIINLAKKVFNQTTKYKRLYPTITGPASSGSLWSCSVANYLSLPFIYCEKNNDKMVYSRGFPKFINESNFIIVEDIVTTGRSVKKTINAIERNNGKVLGIICIANRSKINKIDLIPIESLVDIKINHWSKSNCPMCKKGMPLVDPKSE